MVNIKQCYSQYKMIIDFYFFH